MSIDSSSKAALHKGYKHWCPEVESREDWDKDFNFVLIRSIEELKKLDVEHKFVAWDTETSGLNPDIDWLVGFSFSFDGKTGYYVPVKHDDIALGKEALDIFFSILSKAGTQFLYNCRFDQRFFEAAGYSLEGLRYYDVMNAIWLADTNVLMPSLKASERRFLGWIPKTFSETLGEATTFQHVPAEDAYKYACTDALGTYHLALISNQFYKESYPASKYDNDALYPMMRLENTPQRLDLEYLKSLCSSVEIRIEESLQQVYQLAGCTFNVNSPAQFGKIMLERFGVDTGVRTPTGAMKADLKTLEAWMVKHGSKASPEVKDFLSAYKEYKKTVKFKSSYLDKYIKAAEDADTFPIRFSYKFQSVPCLTENNTVLTKSRGFVSIKDVQSGDMIWTAWGYKHVLWNHSHEVDEFYRVTLKNGMTLEGTGHHPVLVRKSPLEKVAYSGMTKDDVEWAGIQDLKPDEPVVVNHVHASLSCQDSWKSSLARIMGYFYGKGKMTDGVLMSLCFDNKDLAYHYYGWMKSLFGDKKVSRYDVDKGKVEYSITRQTLAKFLSEHEVIPTVEEDCLGNLKMNPVSTYTKVADRLSRMPDTFRHFLAGYLDSAKTSARELGYKEIPENWDDGITTDRVVFVIPSACKDVIIPMFWASAIACKVTDHTFKTWFGEGKVTRVEVSDPCSLSNLLSLWNNQDVGLDRFSCVELPNTFRLYTESLVQSVEHVHANTVVYDIEVEDVHEYVAGGIVTHNTGRLSCLSHDALVHTRQGLVPIVDITEEHDIEVSPNKFAKAKLVHTGEQDFVKIVMSSGKKIECTTDHRFLCPSDEGFVWRYARDLKVSDMLCRTPVTFTGCDINFEMFVYGFFLGDGSYYSKESKNKYSLRMFFCEKDHDAMMYIHDGLAVRGIPHSMRPCKDSLWVIELAKEGSRRLSEMFPVENVKQSERRVDFSYIHSKVDAFSVLAGVYQAEGEKCIRPDDGKMNSALNVTSYALVQSLQRLADYVGIRTKIHTIKIDQVKHPTHHKQWRLQFCVKSFRKYLDSSIPFRINTKKYVPKFLIESLNNLPKDVWKVGERAKFKALYHSKRYSLYSVMRLCEYSELPIEVFDYEQVVSIEPCGKKEAYTLAVDDPLHRYIAEGFIHHNCGGDKKNSFFTQNNVQCLEEDTSVLTSEGIKPIKQVNTGDLVWTGSEFAPCQQLGSRKKICEPICTYFGSITASLEHKFLTLNLDSFDLEFNVLANVISQGLPVVRNVHDGGFTFRELIENEKFKDSMLFRPELSEEVVECLSEKFRDVRFDMVKSAKYFWQTNIIPPEVTVYDLFVPKFERFVANGFIVHNSTPKPHSLMVKGRKATQEEINQGKDILGWYLSNDIPDDEAVGLVEGMDPDHFNLRRAFLPKDDDCYVVSIDMKAEELRLVANIYNEKTWADAFIHGKDVHKACYSPDTEFLVLDHGWMTADRITKGMKIAYYDPMDDEVRFAKAGERYSHEASEVYMHPTLFNVTDNHRMWIGTPDAGFHIVRASELKSQGNPKQKFRMKTAVGQRKSFQSIESHFGRKLGQYFCYGFMYFAPHYYDEEGFVHITLDSPCTKIPHDFALFLNSGDFSSTKFSVDRELSLGLRSLEASNPCTHLFSLAKTEYKDEPIFLQDFVYGMLVYLSSTKFNTLNLGDGSKVSGKVVVSSKEHADAIQWLLMLTGSTCRVDSSKSSLYGEGAYVLTIFSDVSSLPKSLGSTFGSVKQKNIAEKHLTYSCFSVPSGLLVTRYKGQITVNGNTAIKLFGEENYSKEARKKSKIASFGILYGSGAQGFNSSFPEMSLDECRQFLAKFKEALPSIEQGQSENVAYAREHGTINTGYGRQRRVRSYFQSGDRAQVAFAERTVKNSVVQGTAADVLKLIFCRLWANVFKPYPDVTFMSTIHDEVNFSMPKRLAREVIPICMECMTIRRDDWPVTLECSLSIGRDSLGDLIPFTYNKETKEFTPEWEESSEVLKKRTGHVETVSSDNESLDVEESDDPYFGLPPEACEF